MCGDEGARRETADGSIVGAMSYPDDLKNLWAPWRVEYFSIDRSRDFLTEAAQASDDAAHLVVARRKNAFLIMNRFPYAVGHMMAVPYRKVADIADLTEAERLELWDLAALAQGLLRRTVKAQGFNIGLNIGACAGGLRRSSAPAHRAALGRGQQFHAGARGRPGDGGVAAGDVWPAGGGVE